MIVLLTYASCAAIYLLLGAIILAQARRSRAGWLLAAASIATAAWAASVAVFPGWSSRTPALLEIVRAGAWYAVTLYLYRRTIGDRVRAVRLAWVGLVLVLASVASVLWAGPSAVIPLRMLLAVGQLVLTENLYRGVDHDRRWHVGLACVALGGLARCDRVRSAAGGLFPREGAGLGGGRAAAAILVAPLLAVAAARNRDWKVTLHASRAAAFHSVVLMGTGVFLMSLAAVAELVGHSRWAPDPGWTTLIEVCLVFGGAIGMAAVLVSASTRHWMARLVADHFFTYRYDYRREWLACIATLSAHDSSDPDGLRERAVRALADIVDSPAGLLLESEVGHGGFCWAGSWNLPATGPVPPGHPLPAAIATNPCLELDQDLVACPPFAGLRLWLAIALPGQANGPAAGIVLLAPPRGPFRVDEEVTALLGVVAREVATRLAEQRAMRTLVETRDLRAYGERFAFVAHDIKNVAGQLRLLTANARTHISNPEFQSDMLATIDASVRKIGALIRRLELVEGTAEPAAAALWPRLEAACAARRAIRIVAPASVDWLVAMAEADLDAVLTHLIDNAVTAAGPAGTVRLAVDRQGSRVQVDISDDGPGMTAAFIRDELFRPFSSRTEGGSGIGAFQSRELIRRHGGDLVVMSREGEGTTMRLLLRFVERVENFKLSA